MSNKFSKHEEVFEQLTRNSKLPSSNGLNKNSKRNKKKVEYPLPRHNQDKKEKFLRGPIPWDWLIRAKRQPGKTLEVGILLWHLAWLGEECSIVKLSNHRIGELGISKSAKSRAIKQLTKAGLVKRLNPKNNKSITVKILPCPKEIDKRDE